MSLMLNLELAKLSLMRVAPALSSRRPRFRRRNGRHDRRRSSVRPLLKSGLGFERGPRGRERRRGKLARRRAFPHRQGKPPFSACPLQKTPNFRVNAGNVGPRSPSRIRNKRVVTFIEGCCAWILRREMARRAWRCLVGPILIGLKVPKF